MTGARLAPSAGLRVVRVATGRILLVSGTVTKTVL